VRGFCEQAEFLKEDLEQAKQRYAPRARWSTLSLAEHMIAVVQGAFILAKAKQDRELIRSSLLHLREYLSCLFKE
jgi:TetR/AcrR family transcriptional repressor of nem operon